MNTALAAITLDQQTENEIRAATYAGMTVTTHEALINYAGWTGAGYNLIDTASGAGAYKISGGENGGMLILAAFSAMIFSFIFSVMAVSAVTAVGATLIIPILLLGAGAVFAAVSFASTIDGFLKRFEKGQISQEELVNIVSFTSWLNIAGSALGVIFPHSKSAEINGYMIGLVDAFVNHLHIFFIELRSTING